MSNAIQVLHVDDDPSIVELTATFLERDSEHFSVQTASSADAAFELLGDDPPDCIVSDYNMPGLDGIDFLRSVREDFPELPFILYTGKGSEAVASEAIAADVTDYLQKESGTDHYELLANKIQNAVEARREAKRAERQEQLMRLTEFAGDTGGFETDMETGDIILTDGARRILNPSGDVDVTVDAGSEYFHPDDQAAIQSAIERTQRTGEQVRDTYRYRPDGDQRFLEFTFDPVTTDESSMIRGSIKDVTERRQRQRELRLLQTAIDDANVSITLADPSQEDEPLVYVNEAFEEMTGYPSADTLGRNCRFLQGEDTDSAKVAALRSAIDKEEPVSVELRNYRKDGTEFWNRLTVTPIYDEDGDMVRYLGTQEDITERKERERELERSQELLRHSERMATLGGAEINPQTGEVRWTAGTREIHEVGPDFEPTVGNALDFFVPEDRKAIRRQFDDCVDTGGSFHGEYQLRTAEDRVRWVELHAEAVREHGETVLIRGAIQDITDRKDRQQELEAERQFIAQALDTLDDLFYVLNPDGTLRRWNEQVPDVTGYAESALDGMPAIELFPEEHRRRITEAIETTLADGEATVEADLLTADGERIPHEFTGARLTDNDGNLTGLVGVGRDLTERRQREQRFQTLVEESNDVISVVDAEGRYRYQSPSLEWILGYEPEETIGEEVWDYIHPDDRERVRAEFEAWVRNPSTPSDRIEYRARHADGSWRWMEARGHDQPENSPLEGFAVNSRDITEQKDRQQSLEEYKTIVEALTDAIYVLDEEGRFTYINDQFVELVGYDRERILGSKPSLIKDEAAVDRAEAELGRLLSNDGPDTVTFELNVEPATGEPIVSEDHMGVLPYEGDGFDGSVGILRDMSDRKEREQELETLKTQYETLAENFPDGAVYLIDSDLQFLRASGEELHRHGLSPDQFTGNRPADLFPTEIADELSQHITKALDGTASTFEQTYRGERYRLQTVPVRSDDQDIRHVMGVSQNVTEQVADKRELERQNQRLEEFADIVSHDLRNPLGVAETYIELAAAEGDSDHLRQASEAIERSQALIDDLLTLAKQGEAVAETEPVALATVAETSWQTVETRQATLDVAEGVTVEADGIRLTQLLENLYRNAIEHSDETVTVSVGPVDDGFYVADSGPGISEAERSDIFDAGYTTREEGTGFGLRIVEQIATAHGWAITVTESAAGGARFEFTGVESPD